MYDKNFECSFTPDNDDSYYYRLIQIDMVLCLALGISETILGIFGDPTRYFTFPGLFIHKY